MTKTNYILVMAVEAPVADFTANPTSGEAPLMVAFSNTSSGMVDQYDWDFGDGGTSQEVNPEHTYVSVGNYTVSLTATGPGGVDTETKVDYILIPVGINNESAAAYVVYPNPVTHMLNITFPNDAERQLELVDGSGKLLLSSISVGNKTQLNTKSLRFIGSE